MMMSSGVDYFKAKQNLRGPVVSFDVECVATGLTHAARHRAPAQVALVDSNGKLMFGAYIKLPPDEKIVSYLTPISGIRKGVLEPNGTRPSEYPLMTMDEAREGLKKALPKDAIVVGQKIDSDIDWMGLREGSDFADKIDLSEVFKLYNPKYGNMAYHSLVHEARYVLSMSRANAGAEHDPADDARMSVELWNKVLANPGKLPDWQRMLRDTRPAPSVAKQLGHVIEGVCLCRFNPRLCVCGEVCD